MITKLILGTFFIYCLVWVLITITFIYLVIKDTK
jgi:hypothetical protein